MRHLFFLDIPCVYVSSVQSNKARVVFISVCFTFKSPSTRIHNILRFSRFYTILVNDIILYILIALRPYVESVLTYIFKTQKLRGLKAIVFFTKNTYLPFQNPMCLKRCDRPSYSITILKTDVFFFFS